MNTNLITLQTIYGHDITLDRSRIISVRDYNETEVLITAADATLLQYIEYRVTKKSWEPHKFEI